MKLSHLELQNFFDNMLPIEVQAAIAEFIENEIEEKSSNYITDKLWISDQSLGGVGAYCIPPDPKLNPFPGGQKRELFRPLQYARADIDICDVNIHARNVVHMSGMHLEAVCRLVLKTKTTIGAFRFNGTTLGKAVHKIENFYIIDSSIIEGFYSFIAIYNRSKHEINQDDTKERLFNAFDAVVAYFAARILGLALLRYINYPDSNDVFKINNDRA